MSFRWFLVAALCGLIDGMASTPDAEKHPLGWGDFSCFGNTVVKTQHIDRPASEGPLLDMQQLLDVGTLGIKILSKWHVVEGDVPTRQKLVTIRVGELVPGKEYRVPVRMIVPLDRKAKGFHLTGGHQLARIRRDARPRGVERELLRGGVGLVHTIVQVLAQSGQAELGRAADERFIKTLDPRHSIQYWGWPATLIRAVTAAHAEKQHFQVGKIALSGASKNGASPSAAILHDKRMTALHSSVAPIWDSPLRLCDRGAWNQLRAENLRYVQELKKDDPTINTRRLLNHRFLGGTFGPVYNAQALAAGHHWNDLQRLARRMADHVFVARHLPALKARKVDLYFHPGTHDFVAFDMAWGGRHHPRVPVYLRVNSGHGKRADHPAHERDEQNKAAFLLRHFFDGVEPLLEPPSVQARVEKRRLLVSVSFKPGSRAETGRICWMYDRAPDGSAAYIREPFPRDQWKEMTFDRETNTWTTTIDLKTGASRIDFFSNHRKTIRYRSVNYASYLSSPYTRVSLRHR